MTTAIKVSKKLQKLAAVGVNFKRLDYRPGDAPIYDHDRKTPLKEEVPFGGDYPGSDIQYHKNKIEGEAIRKRKQIRPSKPTDMDYQKIIMASLEDLKSNLMEAKIAIAHNHHIEWYGIKQASLGDPHPPTQVGRYAKYWLLNAKDVNGNGWGVNKSSIEHNIGYFVNRPFVITAKTWIPKSAYDSYDHPYLPTNDLYAVLRHQEPYRVGTIREITHEGDDYYAIIEMKQKYAHLALPAFCSPAIFQVDYREPENNITKWIPLHLAGLDTSPAYGARIALLRGSCLGTSNACSIQLKTAKLLFAATGINFKSDKEIEDENFRGYTSPAIRGDDMDEFIRSRRNLEKAEKESRRDEEVRNAPYPSNQEIDKLNTGYKHYVTGEKIRPSKPTQEDRVKTMEAKIICPQKIASKLRDLRKQSGIQEEEPDNDADLERFMEQKDERFKRDIDRHVTRGGKQLSADEQPSVKINPEHGKQIADAYGAMKHEPNNPDVKKSYDALINETGKQYSDLIKGGLKIDKIKPGETPYKNSQDMHKDLSENNHLHYFPTEHGFGAGEENKDHPMMRETEFKHEDKPMLANDVFRIVHDINGHHKGGMSGFGPKGEHQAYLTHKKMFSPEAQGALASETMGQNNYVNFGPNGEHNRKDPGHTIYAPQKAGLMPDKIVNGNFHSEDKKIAILQAKLQKLAFERPFKKSLMHENGDLEEVNMYGQRDYDGEPKRLSGFGESHSHAQHLRREYGEKNIKSFKDMDTALDKHKLMRVMDDEKGRTINIGNKATPQQLDTIKKQFETHDKPVRAGITSISRKYHKTFNDFQEAYKNHSGMSGEDVGNQAFKTHTQSLSSKLEELIKVAGFNEVADAFRNKQPLKSGNYESTGTAFHLFGHKIAEHSDKGLRVSNAGYDTPTTYKALKTLGVKAEVKGGVAHINDKPYTNHGSFVTVPYDQVAGKSLIVSKGKSKKYESMGTGFNSSSGLNKLRKFSDTARKRDNFLDQTAIQPEHQKEINKITGIKSKIPKKVIGTSVHHIFPKNAIPGLAHNPNNAITMSRNNHAELHRLNPEITKKLQAKLQKLAIVDDEGFKPIEDMNLKEMDKHIEDIHKRTKGLEDYYGKDLPEKDNTMKTPFKTIEHADKITKYVQEGVKIRPKVKPFSVSVQRKYAKLQTKIAALYDKSCPMNKKRVKNISAKLQLLAMTQETVPSFDEARIRYNLNKAGGRIDHSKGFTYVPKDNKVYDANNKEDALALQKRFGNGKDAIHAIARTDNHSDKLDENHKFNGKTMREHYDDIVKEGKTPTIGGFDEGGDKTTDIATVEPLSDEEARKKIKEHGQRSSGKIHLDGKFEIFS